MNHPFTPSELAARLDTYAFPPMLASRLSAEHGWTPEFTVQVLAEYRRFLYLAVVSERPVTPSKLVDEAWHEHLTLTRDYWDRLCGEVLGRPIHHDVAEPGALQASSEHDGVQQGGTEEAYFYTLDLYALKFRERAPEAVWHDPRTSMAGVNTTKLAVKSARYALLRTWLGTGVGVLLVLAFFAAFFLASNVIEVLFCLGAVVGVLALLWKTLRRLRPVYAVLTIIALFCIANVGTSKFGVNFLAVLPGILLFILLFGSQFKGSVFDNLNSPQLAGAGGVGTGGGDGGGHGGCGGGGCGGGGCGGGGCGGGG